MLKPDDETLLKFPDLWPLGYFLELERRTRSASLPNIGAVFNDERMRTIVVLGNLDYIARELERVSLEMDQLQCERYDSIAELCREWRVVLP